MRESPGCVAWSACKVCVCVCMYVRVVCVWVVVVVVVVMVVVVRQTFMSFMVGVHTV